MLFAFDSLTEHAAAVTVVALIAFLLAYEGWLLANRFRQRRGEPPLRIRFSMRDLLWLTVVAALAVGWCLDHSKLERKVDTLLHPTIVDPFNPHSWSDGQSV